LHLNHSKEAGRYVSFQPCFKILLIVAQACGFAGADFLVDFAGLDFPNEPLKILPFFVFLSPLPILFVFKVIGKKKQDKRLAFLSFYVGSDLR